MEKIKVTEKETIKKMDTLENVLNSGDKNAVLEYLKNKNIFEPLVFKINYIKWMLKEK